MHLRKNKIQTKHYASIISTFLESSNSFETNKFVGQIIVKKTQIIHTISP
jgi:hypothetical protein